MTRAFKLSKEQIAEIQQIIEREVAKHGENVVRFSRWLEINNTHVYLAIGGKVTPTLLKAMIKKGLIAGPETRTRLPADCSDNQRVELKDWITNTLCLASWTTFVRQLANSRDLRRHIEEWFRDNGLIKGDGECRETKIISAQEEKDT